MDILTVPQYNEAVTHRIARPAKRIQEKSPQAILYQLELLPQPHFSRLNREAEALTGMPYEAILADPYRLIDLVHPDDRPAFTDIRWNAGAAFPNEFRVITPVGGIRWLAHTWLIETDDSGTPQRVNGSLTDITAWKSNQEELDRSDQRVKVLLALNQMRDSSLEDIGHYTLEQAVTLTGSQYGYFAFTRKQETELQMFSWSTRALVDCRIKDYKTEYQVSETGLWGEAIRQRKPVITNQYSSTNLFVKGTPEGHIPLTRHMSVPIFDGSKIVAVAGVANKPEDYDEGDVDQLTLLMNAMWRIIQHRRMLETLRNSDERYKTFLKQNTDGIYRIEMSSPIPVSLDEDTQVRMFIENGFLDECNDIMAQFFGFDNPAAGRGTPVRDLFSRSSAPYEPFVRKFISNQHSLRNIESVETDSLGNMHYFTNTLGGIIEDGMLVRAWGTRRDITEQKRSSRIQAAVFQISQAASTYQSLYDLYHSIHTSLGGLMPVQNFFIAIYNQAEATVSYPYFVDQYDEQPEPEAIGRTLTGYVLRTGKALLASPQVFEEMVARGEVDSVGSPSIDWLGVPLIAEEKIIGILAVQSYTEGIRFTEEHKDLLQFVSNQIALVIEKKQAEQVLRESEARYRGIVEDQTEFICRWRQDGTVTFTNEAFCRYLGLPREELNQVNVLEFIHPDDEEMHDKVLEQVRTTGDPVSYEMRTIMHAREMHWEQWTTRALLDSQGHFLEYQSVGRDITERKLREHELEAISSVSSALRSANNRVEMLPIIADRLMELLQVDGVAMAIMDSLENEVEVEIGRGIWQNTVGIRLPTANGITGTVISEGNPIVFNNLKDDDEIDTKLLTMEFRHGIDAAICYPLTVNRQPIGIVWVGKKGTLNGHTLRILSAISDIAANAIVRSSLHEQTKLSLQRLSVLQAIDMAISASLDLRLTLSILLDQVTLQMGVDAASILLLNNYTQALEFASGRGFQSSSIQNTYLRLGQGHAGKAALERKIVTIPNLFEAADATIRRKALTGEGFTGYIAIPLVSKGHVKGVLELFYRKPFKADHEFVDFLQSLGANAAIAIDNAELFDNLQRSNLELSLAYDATIEGWSRALELRDRETEGHTQRVASLTSRLARAVGIPDTELLDMRRGALLHDIGKMAIPDNVLLKAGPLSGEEWEVMRKHPEFAYQLLSPIAYLKPALDIPRYHHEKWDGTGYPFNLRGELIPLSARIFAIVDVWDALLSDRPYRPAWPKTKALEYIRSQAGSHFDPRITQVFLHLMEEEQ